MSISAAIAEGRLSARDAFFSGIYAESSGDSGHVIEINAKVTEGSIPQTKSGSGFKVHGGPKQFHLEPVARRTLAPQQDCRTIRERQRPGASRRYGIRTEEEVVLSTVTRVSSRCSLPKSLELILYYCSYLTLVYNLCFSKKSPQDPRPRPRPRPSE